MTPNSYPLLAGLESIQSIGGAELQQVIIAKGLVGRGYRVSMICLDFGQPDGIDVHGIKVFRAFRPDEGIPVVRFFWPRMTSLWSCLSCVDADIYYQRAASMLTGLVAAFCKLHKKKSIFAVAGEPMIRFRRDRWIYRFGVKNVDQIVVQNTNQARQFEEVFARNSVLVPNCLPAPTHPRAGAGRSILWVSTIRAIKRPELFLELARAFPQYPFTMIGGPGDGEQGLYESVREQASNIPNLRFTGFVPFASVDSYFDEAALLINTSDTEGFPNTFLQAWARGVPTVSFVDCGAREFGRTVGNVVRNYDEMVAVVVALMGDESRRISEGAACRQYFMQNHSPERSLDLYEHLFARMCADRAEP